MIHAETVVRAIIAVMLVAVVLALYPYTRDATAPVKYLLLSWGAVVAAVALCILGTLQKVPWHSPRVFFVILAAFIGVNLLAAVFSSHPGHAMVTWRRFAVLFIVYLIASQVYREPRHVSVLMLFACVGVTLSTVYAVIQYQGLDPFPWESTAGIYRRLPGTFGNPNYAAHTMILCIIMAVFLATQRRMRWCAVFAIIFLIHMRFTAQRGGLVGLAAAGALLLLAMGVRKYVTQPRRAVAVTLVIVALLIPVAVGGVLAISKSRTGIVVPLGRSPLSRYHGYDGAARMILARPLLGYGPGNYQIHNPFFWTIEEQDWFVVRTRMNQRVHNDVLEAGVEAGFPGAVLYMLFLVAGMGQGLIMGMTAQSPERRRLGWAFAALFCAFLVDGLFGFNFRLPASALLIFLVAGTLDGVHVASDRPRAVPARSGKVLTIRLGMVVFTLVAAIYETRTFAAERQMQLGRGAFLGGAFGQADSHFQRAETLSPWDWLAPFERAKCALLIADQREARQRPEEGFALRNRAAEHFERSVENNPTYILSLLGAGEAYFSLGHTETPFNRDIRDAYLERARLAAERAVDLCPLMPEGHDLLGRILSLQAMEMHAAHVGDDTVPEEVKRQWHTAIDHLERATELGTRGRGALYLMLVQARMNIGELDDAEDALRRALDADLTNESLLPLLSRFGAQFNRYTFVRDTLDVYLVRLGREAAEQRDLIARTALQLAALEQRVFKNEDHAERAYVQAARAAPRRADTWAAFAQFSKQSNRPEAFQREVTRAYQEAVEAEQDPLPQIRAVVEVWEDGSERLPEMTGVLDRAFRNALQRGVERAEARQHFGWPAEVLLVETQRAGVSEKVRGVALLNLGSMLHAMDHLSLAATVLQAAINELPPKQAALAAREASQVLERQNRPDDALRLLQQAVSLDPENPETRMALAGALAKLDHTDAAREEYRRILQMPGLQDEQRKAVAEAMRTLE